MNHRTLYAMLGRSWCRHMRKRARWAGTYVVAKRLRQRGIGLQTALTLLTR